MEVKDEREGERKVFENQISQLLMVYNSKFGGGRMLLNPPGQINDGYFELTFLKDLVGFGPITKLFDGCKKGGVQFFDPAVQVYRL